MKRLRHDHYLLGGLIGLVMPAVAFGLFILALHAYASLRPDDILPAQHKFILLSIGMNLLPLRYYFVNLKYDKTGRGLLVMTAVEAALYFLLVAQHPTAIIQ